MIPVEPVISAGVLVVVLIAMWYVGWLQPAETLADIANREIKKFDADSKVSYIQYMANIQLDKEKLTEAKNKEKLLEAIE